MEKMKVASVVLTKNEEPRIEECLKHLRPYVDYILVLDACSNDKTVEVAKKYADRVKVKEPAETFPEERNYARSLIPKDCLWILWVDVDERFDIGFLRNIKIHVETAEKGGAGCFRFPRVNLPDGKDFPDYQVRLFPNSRDIEWRGIKDRPEVCIPYLKREGIPLDQADQAEREEKLYVITKDEYPIIHLPRRKDIRRPWWYEMP